MDKLAEALKDHIVVFDGAIGTELYKRNFFVNTSFEGLNLTAPQVIHEIHRSYVEAGAEVITTNSYAANRNILGKFGLEQQVAQINQKAAEMARAETGDGGLVAGSVGPVGEAPFQRELSDDARIEILCEQISALVAGGVDFIIFETLSCRADVEQACLAAQKCAMPYVISFSVDRDGCGAKGEPLEVLLKPLKQIEQLPSALGLNCGEGPESSLRALELLLPLADFPVIVQPNAGQPKNVDGRSIYMTSPEYLTTYALRYSQMGARGLGGCCGTGPEHIRDIARSVKPVAASSFTRTVQTGLKDDVKLQEPLGLSQRSGFGAGLFERKWMTTIELTPPRGYDMSAIIARARECAAAGVCAINIPDGPRASSRLSPLIAALEIQRQAEIEVILHFCCRDKNLIGMQADLLGCAAVGLHNILFITGDPPKLGDYPFASGVFDADSIGMVKIQDRLNRGVDLGGMQITPATGAVIGVGADPNAVDMKRELRRTHEKIDAGAEFIITQPVFDAAALLRFLDAMGENLPPVLAGIWPLASYRNAEFMRNEVPGVVVPDGVMQRMAAASDREEQRAEGIKIAQESVRMVRERVQGIQVSAPFGNVATALAVVAASKQ